MMLMRSETFQFFRYLIGARGPRTAVSARETARLIELADGRSAIAEIGSYEGATSSRLAQVIREDGVLFLIDPYTPQLRLEKLLGVSFPRLIAHREVGRYGPKVRFIRATSAEALEQLAGGPPLDLVFIDADHSYEHVRRDFAAWSRLLAPTGSIALHDSGICQERPDLTAATGPVRLVREILAGDWPPWKVADQVESLTVVEKRIDLPSPSMLPERR